MASTKTRPAPPTARLPRWTRCQSSARPSLAQYWHIGETTTRLRNVVPSIVKGLKRSTSGKVRLRVDEGRAADPDVHRRGIPDQARLRLAHPSATPGCRPASKGRGLDAAPAGDLPIIEAGDPTATRQPTGWEDPPGARRPGEDRVGPEGLEPSPTRLRAGRAAANTLVPFALAKSARRESNPRLAVINRRFSR